MEFTKRVTEQISFIDDEIEATHNKETLATSCKTYQGLLKGMAVIDGVSRGPVNILVYFL
jgi:hypothetical protein